MPWLTNGNRPQPSFELHAMAAPLHISGPWSVTGGNRLQAGCVGGRAGLFFKVAMPPSPPEGEGGRWVPRDLCPVPQAGYPRTLLCPAEGVF